MAFTSVYATLIWDKLYTVHIPDQLTQNPDYLRQFGTYSSGNKEVDAMMATDFIMVMIPIIQILEYFENGIEVRIPNREDMIQMHRDIELYLSEWEEHIRRDINLAIAKNKKLLLSLEQLSRRIYDKAQSKEIMVNLFDNNPNILRSPLERLKVQTVKDKPEYTGISRLIRSKAIGSGRF